MADETEIEEAPQPAETGFIDTSDKAKPAPPEPHAEPVAAHPHEPDLETLLAEFDEQIAKPSTSPPEAEPSEPVLGASEAETEQTWQSPAPTVPAQFSENDSAAELREYRSEVSRYFDVQHFNERAAKVQAQLPDHLPDDYAEAALLRAAVADPSVALAFDLRNTPHEDLVVARAELAQIQATLRQAGMNPWFNSLPVERRTELVRQWQERGWMLYCAVNAEQILRKAERDVIAKGRQVRPQLNEAATETKLSINHYMRGASSGNVTLKEPAPDFSRMSNAELREWQEINLGSSQI
jgi:hypothetical protein